ncbi:MAG TPA: hypothetical protein VHN10_09185 [Candidatus Acidoferrales bacterium]|nr:hypothetical protein [Candidatus Acidoferrales bacterium]
MDEGRKRVLAILTAILAAPRLADWNWDGRTGAPACESVVITALGAAERIMEMIDRRHGNKTPVPNDAKRTAAPSA